MSTNHKRITIYDVRGLFIRFGSAGIDARNEAELHQANADALDELIRDHDRNVLQLSEDDVARFILAANVKGLTGSDVRRGLRAIYDRKI